MAMQFVPARWFYPGRRKSVRVIVVHCTVSPESGGGAEAVANYFATTARRASAHRTADSNSIVMSVRDEDTAFAAAGANADGIHLELVGYPNQSAGDWLDDFGAAMMVVARPTIREWASEYAIPYRWLTVAEVADGTTKGFCTHHDVSRAFPDVSTGHYDPGIYFPKAAVMAIWRPSTVPTPTIPLEDDMAFLARRKDNPTGTFLFEDNRRTTVASEDVDNFEVRFGKTLLVEDEAGWDRLIAGRTLYN